MLKRLQNLFKKKDRTIVLIDKPKGLTSFDVIRKLRRKLGVRKMGHAGTLDPLATGLLIIVVGEGTKKLKDLIGLPKTYVVEILLGKKTTTGDLEGKVIENAKIENLKTEKVEGVLNGIVGTLELQVPLYSAIKKKGKPLYKYARDGEKVEIPIKKMKINSAELISLMCENNECVISAKMDVESGTYIRSVAEEIGRRLGYPATVRELRRTRIGDFYIKDAEKI